MNRLFRLRMFAVSLCSTTFLIFSPASAERGKDGQLNLLYWQAPSIINAYLSGGTKDIEAASLVLEPLARYDETGAMVPTTQLMSGL